MKASDAAAQASRGAAGTAEAPGPDVLAAELLTFWHSLMRGTARDLWTMLEDLGLSMTHVKTLHNLSECAVELSVKELSAALGMSLPNTSRTVDALLRKGYLERREDEYDRRVKRVAITAAGRAVVERIDTARLRGLATWAAELTPAQRAQLHAALLTLRSEEPA